MSETVFVICRNATGEPDCVDYSVEVDEHERADGLHYQAAQEQAREAGYDALFVAFDSTELDALIDAGDRAREAAGRVQFLVQGRNFGDDDDTAFVVEAEDEADAEGQLKASLVEDMDGPFESVEDYERAEENGTLEEADSIFVIGVARV